MIVTDEVVFAFAGGVTTDGFRWTVSSLVGGNIVVVRPVARSKLLRLVMVMVEVAVVPCSTVTGEEEVETEKSLLAWVASDSAGSAMKATVLIPVAARADSTTAQTGAFFAKKDILGLCLRSEERSVQGGLIVSVTRKTTKRVVLNSRRRVLHFSTRTGSYSVTAIFKLLNPKCNARPG